MTTYRNVAQNVFSIFVYNEEIARGLQNLSSLASVRFGILRDFVVVRRSDGFKSVLIYTGDPCHIVYGYFVNVDQSKLGSLRGDYFLLPAVVQVNCDESLVYLPMKKSELEVLNCGEDQISGDPKIRGDTVDTLKVTLELLANSSLNSIDINFLRRIFDGYFSLNKHEELDKKLKSLVVGNYYVDC